METMHLIQPPKTTDLVSLPDADIEAFFASAGLSAEVVSRCSTVGCSVCFAGSAVQAA